MVASKIEQLKRQYTDKYVKVDAARPELARFRDVVGQVKTVNMSGRALVEFLDYNLNIGWYDIDLSCLTFVDKPEPKSAEAKHAEPRKPPAEKAAAKPAAPAAAKPAAGKKLSVAEMLAAARKGDGGGKPSAPAAKAAPADTPKPVSAAKPKGKMSVAEMLAAARAADSSGGQAAETKAPVAKAPAEEAPSAAADEAPPAQPAGEASGPAKVVSAIKPVDKSGMSVADMVAYCRAHDAK